MNVRIEGISIVSQKTPAIKLVRALTYWGLKESKDFVEAQTVVNGYISLTLSINHDQPAMKEIKSVEVLKAFIASDNYTPLAYSNIVCLDAPAKKTRKTIAGLERELADTRNAYDITSKALSNAKNDLQSIYTRQNETGQIMSTLQSQLNRAQFERDEMAKENRDLHNEVNSIQSQLDGIRDDYDTLSSQKNSVAPHCLDLG